MEKRLQPFCVEAAVDKWMARLDAESRLPGKTALEMLRRREVSAREQAELLAEAEKRFAHQALERLEDERRLAARHTQKVSDLAEDLRLERSKRLEAEAEAYEARSEIGSLENLLKAEEAAHGDLKFQYKAMQKQVQELQSILNDDQSLLIIDELRRQLDSQRCSIESLKQRLDAQKSSAAAAESALQKSREELSAARSTWEHERAQFVQQARQSSQEIAKLQLQLKTIQEAGTDLQTSAESVLSLYPDALRRLQEDLLQQGDLNGANHAADVEAAGLAAGRQAMTEQWAEATASRAPDLFGHVRPEMPEFLMSAGSLPGGTSDALALEIARRDLWLAWHHNAMLGHIVDPEHLNPSLAEAWLGAPASEVMAGQSAELLQPEAAPAAEQAAPP